MFTSEVVLEEASKGDAEASKKRLISLKGIPLLELTDKVSKLAKELISQNILPSTALDDALHISLSTIHNIDYLLTWNCRHIDNAEIKPSIRKLIENFGFNYPEICTPQELLGGEDHER